MKVSTASGSASGIPSSTRPMPMNTASMRLTSAWTRMNPPRTSHIRRSTSAMCPPALRPVIEVSHGRNRGPSLTKKNVSTRASTSETSPDATVDTPVRTPPAMEVALCCSCWVTWVMMSPIWLSPRFSGGPEIHCWIWPSAAITPEVICWVCPAIDGAMPTNRPVTAAMPTSSTTAEAAAGGKRHRMSSAAGGRRTVASRIASTTGQTTTHSMPVT